MWFKSSSLLLATLLMAGVAGAQEQVEGDAFRFYQQAYLEHDSSGRRSYAIVPGDFLVFEFVSYNSAEPGNGSRAESRLTFQVEPGAKEFVLRDKEIMDHRGIYIQVCRCADRGIQLIERGVIKGKKTGSDAWDIVLDIYVTGRSTGKVYHIQEAATYHIAQK